MQGSSLLRLLGVCAPEGHQFSMRKEINFIFFLFQFIFAIKKILVDSLEIQGTSLFPPVLNSQLTHSYSHILVREQIRELSLVLCDKLEGWEGDSRGRGRVYSYG